MEKKCYSVNVHYDLCRCFHGIIAESEAEAEKIAREMAMGEDKNDWDCCEDEACIVDAADILGICPKCGGPLVKSELPDYDCYCRKCDEDFYNCEV